MDSPPARSGQTLIGTERQQLEAFLDDNRSELAGALTGLTEEQAATAVSLAGRSGRPRSRRPTGAPAGGG